MNILVARRPVSKIRTHVQSAPMYGCSKVIWSHLNRVVRENWAGLAVEPAGVMFGRPCALPLNFTSTSPQLHLNFTSTSPQLHLVVDFPRSSPKRLARFRDTVRAVSKFLVVHTELSITSLGHGPGPSVLPSHIIVGPV